MFDALFQQKLWELSRPMKGFLEWIHRNPLKFFFVSYVTPQFFPNVQIYTLVFPPQLVMLGFNSPCLWARTSTMFLSSLLHKFPLLVTASKFSLFVLQASCVSMQVFYYTSYMPESSLRLMYWHHFEVFESSSYLSSARELFSFFLLIMLKTIIYLIYVIDLATESVA